MMHSTLHLHATRTAGTTPDAAARTAGERAVPASRRVVLKSAGEIELMHSAGQVVRAALRAAAASCVPGVTTASVAAAAEGVIAAFRAEPLFLNHRIDPDRAGFPATTCVSVNDELVHGVPGPRRLVAGDLVTIDCGVRLRGWCADAAVTVPVGSLDALAPERRTLIEDTERLLDEAIAAMAPGVAWSSIAERLEHGARARGYGIVTAYMGHGIGRDLHEAPAVPNALLPEWRRHDDFTLMPGMTLAIEPMLVLGGDDDPEGGVRTRTLDDGWTVVVDDGRPACHVEHTVAVTRSGVRVLTGPLHPSIREEAAQLR